MSDSELPSAPDPPDPPEEVTSSGGYDYDELAAYHHQIIRIHVAHGGELTQEQIGEKVGVTKQTVNHVLNSKLGQLKIKKMQQHLDSVAMENMEKVHELAKLSLMELEEMLLDPNTDPKLKTRIAQDMLDRDGTKKPEKHEVAHAHFTKGDLEEIKERANQTGKVVEIEDESEE